jgi:hypothetical protein
VFLTIHCGSGAGILLESLAWLRSWLTLWHPVFTLGGSTQTSQSTP